MVHRDEVHGDVRFDRLAVALLDTSVMQRLGRVYQLGFAPLVYRGGNHTRLSHVMGAYHAAGKLVDALRRNYGGESPWPRGAVSPKKFLPARDVARPEDQWAILRYLTGWAALLHDLGHVPLGHTLEDEFDRIYERHDDFHSPRAAYLWLQDADGNFSEIRSVFLRNDLLPEVFGSSGITGERVWRAVMVTCFHKESRKHNEHKCFADLLSDAANGLKWKVGAKRNGPHVVAPIIPELIESLRLVEGKLFFPYMADIVADTICADYLDYMQRDPRNLGLDVLKDDRVVSQFWVGERSTNRKLYMALALEDKRGKPRLDTTTGVVDLVRQRYRFAEIVYYHKTKAAASVMFAKALRLLSERIDEVPKVQRLLVQPGEIQGLLDALFAKRSARKRMNVSDFKKRARPSALLDPEIGDESLLLLMQERAISQIERAVPSESNPFGAGNRVRAENGLRALSLLQSIARRQLHKVAFSLDAEAWVNLFRGSGTLAEDDLRASIKELRSNHDLRADIEEKMRQALRAGGVEAPGEDCLLLYVPERKSQAKGIETGALDSGDVITLGEHRAVREQVAELGQRYAALWRFIVFAHPTVIDPFALSRAIDALLEKLVPRLKPALHEGHDGLVSACWFKYLSAELAGAAALYRQLPYRPGRAFDLELARSTANRSIRDEEIASRASLLDALRERLQKPEDAVSILVKTYGNTEGAWSALVANVGTENIFDPDLEVRDAVTVAINATVDDLLRAKRQDRTVSKKRRRRIASRTRH